MASYILKSFKLRFAPLEIFEFVKEKRNCFFLDSSLNSGCLSGRYSFLGMEPFFVLKTKGIDPFLEIRKLIDSYKISAPKIDIPFLGGAVGYLSYDLGLALEKKIGLSPRENLGIPDCYFAFYDSAIIIDHFKNLLHVFATGFPEKNPYYAKKLAETNFRKIYSVISGGRKSCVKDAGSRKDKERFSSSFGKTGYIRAVKRALKYIRAGDIYQVNLSQIFRGTTFSSGFEIYRRLRKLSPACFSAYLDCGGLQILSSSPERFLKLKGDVVTTRPMKGTRPRGKSASEDSFLRQSLLLSAKDKAELTMIVDLERNDLGRVCSYDSIKVDCLRELEEYATVFQTTATVSGRLYPGKDRVDLLRACFPGGSITGCPKIRSMEIIEELEPARRAVYTGSLGFLSFSGDMDFNILIRTILKKNRDFYFGAGSGIVADSDPEQEYEETLVKARAIMEALS